MVPVTLMGRSGQIAETYAFLDSGADCCLFHKKWAERIGLNLYTGRPDKIGGIDVKSKIRVYYHRINLAVGTIKVLCDVGFSEEISEDMNDQLIGRDIVFNRMRFAFRQKILSLYAAEEN